MTLLRWLELTPHDEFALNHWIVFEQVSSGPVAGEAAARRACERLPWSDIPAIHVCNNLVEQGRIEDAIRFLQEVRQQRNGRLTPILNYQMCALQEMRIAGMGE